MLTTTQFDDLVAVAGIGQHTPMRFDNRGYGKVGKTHYTVAPYGVKCNELRETVCGRRVRVMIVYSDDYVTTALDWPTETHETNQCRECAREAREHL